MNSEAIIAEYNQHQKARGLKQTTIADRRTLLRRFCAYLEEHEITNLQDIDRQTILEYQAYVATLTGKRGDPYDARVRNRHITSVRNLFQYLQIKGAAVSDPTADVPLAKEPKPLPRDILTPREMRKLLRQPDTTTWRGIRDRAIMELLYSTAMRRSELLNLQLSDLRADRTALERFALNNTAQ